MKFWTALLLVFAVMAVAYPMKPGGPAPEPLPREPVSMQIVGKGEVVLGLAGRTVAEFRDDVISGRAAPSPLACGLKLRITNNTRQTIRLRATGPTNEHSLGLAGKGGLRELDLLGVRQAVLFVTLKPGTSHTIQLTQLAGIRGTRVRYPMPLSAGEYKLTALLRTYIDAGEVSAGPLKKLGPGEVRTGYCTLTAPPVNLTVKAK
jgi:hypothetical protein